MVMEVGYGYPGPAFRSVFGLVIQFCDLYLAERHLLAYRIDRWRTLRANRKGCEAPMPAFDSSRLHQGGLHAASDGLEKVPSIRSYQHVHAAGRSVELRLQAVRRMAGHSSR